MIQADTRIRFAALATLLLGLSACGGGGGGAAQPLQKVAVALTSTNVGPDVQVGAIDLKLRLPAGVVGSSCTLAGGAPGVTFGTYSTTGIKLQCVNSPVQLGSFATIDCDLAEGSTLNGGAFTPAMITAKQVLSYALVPDDLASQIAIGVTATISNK